VETELSKLERNVMEMFQILAARNADLPLMYAMIITLALLGIVAVEQLLELLLAYRETTNVLQTVSALSSLVILKLVYA